MSNRSPNKGREDYEIPCTLLPATDFDMADSVPPEERVGVPLGGFVKDMVLDETSDFECLPTDPLGKEQRDMIDGDAELVPLHEIPEVLWEGKLEPAQGATAAGGGVEVRAAIGRPKWHRAKDVLKDEEGKPFTPPQADCYWWLLEIPCTVFAPAAPGEAPWENTEAQLEITLRPLNAAPAASARAYKVLSDSETVEVASTLRFKVGGPTLRDSMGASVRDGSFSVQREFRRVFPVIEGYGAGTNTPSWTFRSHQNCPLQGSQIVYAVVGVSKIAGGLYTKIRFKVIAEQRANGFLSVFGLTGGAESQIEKELKFRIACPRP